MIVADASLVIAFLSVHDAHHTTAIDIVIDHEDLLLHPVTAAEVFVGPARSGRSLDPYADLTMAGFRLDTPDSDQARRVAELRARTGLKLPDCYPLDVADLHRAPLATFDTRLAAKARERGIVVRS